MSKLNFAKDPWFTNYKNVRLRKRKHSDEAVKAYSVIFKSVLSVMSQMVAERNRKFART